MLLKIPNVISKQQVKECKDILESASWHDGRLTAGHLSLNAKSNLQLQMDSEEAIKLGDFILSVLSQSQEVLAAALPAKIFPPMFNCYQGGGEYDFHIDNAIRQVPNAAIKIRTDISMTLFFSEPEEYEGGELIIADTYGEKKVKLAAGDLVLYPSTSLHRVTPVTAGRRLASFFWIQSLIRNDEQRTILYQLDKSIQRLTSANSDSGEINHLSGVYHNLLRMWAET